MRTQCVSPLLLAAGIRSVSITTPRGQGYSHKAEQQQERKIRILNIRSLFYWEDFFFSNVTTHKMLFEGSHAFVGFFKACNKLQVEPSPILSAVWINSTEPPPC